MIFKNTNQTPKHFTYAMRPQGKNTKVLRMFSFGSLDGTLALCRTSLALRRSKCFEINTLPWSPILLAKDKQA